MAENPDLGKLILRLTLGILILFHGVSKVFGGVSGIENMLVSKDLPAILAYGVYVGEVIAPLMLIIGYYSRVGAALIVVNMLFALGLAHSHQFFMLGDSGGWQLELQGFFLLTAVAVILLGPGKYKWRH
ncbi:DoxX family protein [Zobellella maritima]|uniref:DoxX family protein n=1 Tax=Zobellella maritima TaxID=2059725 RepID=UPI000E302D83|nr:DoxX family protein [Zobellella maritima]